MKAERVNEGEIVQAMRSQGISQYEQVEAVVLETDGSFSIVQRAADGRATVLLNVTGI